MSHSIKFNNTTEFDGLTNKFYLAGDKASFHQWKDDRKSDNSSNTVNGELTVVSSGTIRSCTEVVFGDGVLGAVLAGVVKLIFAIRAARRKQS